MIERLRQHPFLLAYWLAARNSLRHTRRQPRARWLVAGGLISLVTIVLVTRYTVPHRPPWALEKHANWVAILAMLHAATVVASGRRRAVRELTQSWLAATPLGAATMWLAVVLRTLWPLAWQTLLYAVLLLGLLTGGVIELPLAGRLSLLLLAGGGLGAGIGWYLGRARAATAITQLKSAVVPHSMPSPPLQASLRALSDWPIAQVMVWASPKALRWPFIWASLTVPIGASAMDGLLVIATWAMLFYMVVLVVGVARAAQEAGHWLRVTPLPLSRFARGLLRRALLHQLMMTAVIGVLLLLVYGGENTFWTLYVWTAVLTAAFSIAVAVGHAAQDVRLPLLFGVAVVLMGSSLAPVLALPVAVSCGAWYWRRGLES